MSKLSEAEIIEKLQKIDTPTISNVVATYPNSKNCLKLYDAWYGNWYTDTTIRCIYPDLGPRVGYVATVVFAEQTPKYGGMDRWALPDHIDGTKKPIVLVAQQVFPPALQRRVGLFGEMMSTMYNALGVVAVITDGPMRDVDAIEKIGIQYYATGVTPGHGDFFVKDVGVPVTVGGMTVMPGDMVHMDLHGVVKFPASKMAEVLERAQKLLDNEASSRKIYDDPDFSYAKMKARIQKKYGT